MSGGAKQSRRGKQQDLVDALSSGEDDAADDVVVEQDSDDGVKKEVRPVCRSQIYLSVVAKKEPHPMILR